VLRLRLIGRVDLQLAAPQPQHSQHAKHQPRRHQQRHAPGRRQRDRHQQRRCQRPAQAAGDAVHAVGVRQPVLGDAAVDHGVVHRMEHAVADAGHHRERGQHPVALARGEAQRGHAQQAQTGEQHRPRAVAVDDKARQRLHHARHDEEDRHQEAQLGIADVEGVAQPREQRRQQQLAEVAGAMRQPDQADDGGIAAQRRRRQRECGHGRHRRRPARGRDTIARHLLSRTCQAALCR
jgi:hypothetical protein